MDGKSEFAIGTKVIFKPYKKAVPKYVRSFHIDEQDGEVLYGLADRPTWPVTTNTTGRCIVESKLFVPSDKNGEPL